MRGFTSDEWKQYIATPWSSGQSLQWMLQFPQVKLEEFRGKDWNQLSKDMRDFVLSSPAFDFKEMWRGHEVAPDSLFREKLKKGIPPLLRDRSTLKGLQDQLREALEKLWPEPFPTPENFYVGRWAFPGLDTTVVLQSNVRKPRRVWVQGKRKKRKATSPNPSFRITRRYQAGWPAVFWFAVGEALEKHQEQLTRCRKCHQFFLRTQRQEYCSKSCSQAMRTAKFMKKHQRDLKDLRHQAYVRKMQRKHGENVNVRQNQPKKGRR